MPHTLLFDRSDRLRVLFSGPNATPTLDGLVTNDVKLLAPGQGCYAAILTAKGKIVADVRILRREDDILVDTAPRAASGAWDVFKKYVNPRFATYRDVSGELANFTIAGEEAARIASQLAGIDMNTLAALPPFHHLPGAIEGLPVIVLRTPELGSSGRSSDEPGSHPGLSDGGLFAADLIVPVSLRESLREAALQQGAVASDAETWDALRIRAGWPAWGIDMDDTTLPQEANFDELDGVSYTKGCYIGQEPVARIHFRGHVNKSLRVLTIQSDTPPPQGAQLFGDEDRAIGDLRSVTPLDESHHYQGIGMVRREIANGATLTARWEEGARTVPVQVVRQAIPPSVSNAKGAIG